MRRRWRIWELPFDNRIVDSDFDEDDGLPALLDGVRAHGWIETVELILPHSDDVWHQPAWMRDLDWRDQPKPERPLEKSAELGVTGVTAEPVKPPVAFPLPRQLELPLQAPAYPALPRRQRTPTPYERSEQAVVAIQRQVWGSQSRWTEEEWAEWTRQYEAARRRFDEDYLHLIERAQTSWRDYDLSFAAWSQTAKRHRRSEQPK